jgi:adenylyltransferase/sulfurtransferase
LCGDAPTINHLIDYEAFCNVQLPSQKAAAPADEAALEVSGPELQQILRNGKRITLLDVREPHEWDIARIESARLTPLSKFEEYIPELDKNDEIYLYCYKGKRSMTALKKLQEHGFKNLKSLAGGIDRWSLDVDSSVPRY